MKSNPVHKLSRKIFPAQGGHLDHPAVKPPMLRWLVGSSCLFACQDASHKGKQERQLREACPALAALAAASAAAAAVMPAAAGNLAAVGVAHQANDVASVASAAVVA
eukprot:1152735-Pelagomonas_calceolata.AAC.2